MSDALGRALAAVAPDANPAVWLPALMAAFGRWQFDTPKRKAAALGQFAVEAGSGFSELIENLNYTTPSRIRAVFPSRLRSDAAAMALVGQPEALANRVYAGRNGNGDEASGDGWRFRGRGLIQITGRANYARIAADMHLPLDVVVDWCATPMGAAMSGCLFLVRAECLRLADKWDIPAITRAVNGPAMMDHTRRAVLSGKALDALA